MDNQLDNRKLLKFVILFDNTHLLYFPGQLLTGRVLIELSDETPAMGLHFHVVGEGVVRMQNAKHGSVYDRENYIDFHMKLFGEQAPFSEEEPVILLSPGIHSFPFKLGLPVGLPSTFLGKSGWVQYYCRAALQEPSGLIHKNHQVFIIMNPINLSLEPRTLSQPVRCEIEHKLMSSCMSPGKIFCRVSIDKGGYVPGDYIDLYAYVQNLSKTTIKETKACLMETIEYLAANKVVQTEVKELAVKKKGPIRPGDSQEWASINLYVPALPPTNLRGCRLINIQYDVFFIMTPKSIEKDIKVQLPVVLGTYPFRERDDLIGLKETKYYPSTLPVLRPWMEEKAH